MSWALELDKKLKEYLPELQVLCDEPMSRYTSFRIGGPAKRMAFPKAAELVRLLELAETCGARPLVIGKGSNLLVADEGLDRLVVNTSGMDRMELTGEPNTILAEAGVSLAKLATFACKEGLTGLEFAHGIPGTLGGAVCMNAGAYDGEMKQVITDVTVYFPGEGVRVLSCEEMDFGYRHSLLSDRPEAVVVSAVMRLQAGEEAVIRGKMQELMGRRKASQPLEYPSAGSTFKRPVGHFAGTLIDQCGLKGLTVGGAQVSTKHAGFVINICGATCADVTELIRQVQARVMEEKGVWLEPEVRVVER
jgi:UDP-N-acetylmuramate dehydrogenase